MTAFFLFQWVRLFTAGSPAWWQGMRLPSKLAAGACVVVLGGMAQLGVIVTGHVTDNVIQKAATATALYMDSFVEQHVQELRTSKTLSAANQEALERLLSPASMHRPILGFRIWLGDVIVFSNEREVIGKRIAPTPERTRAWQGHVGVEFELDGDDDVQVRALNLPVLEVYAPVRETGTGRIIALAETHEVAIELEHEVWLQQMLWWLAIVGVALVIIFLLLSIATSGGVERNTLVSRIAELSRLGAESERRRLKISHANLSVSEMTERSWRRIGTTLHHGPAQLVALALLKFDTLHQLFGESSRSNPWHAEDLETIRSALNDTLRHINSLSVNLLPADMEQLSVAETLVRAAGCHERMTGAPVARDTCDLPEQLPFPFKVTLYRYALEGLDSTRNGAEAQELRASSDGEKIELEIVGSRNLADGKLASDTCPPELTGLRDRVEAVGGTFSCQLMPTGGLSLTAQFSLSEVAGGR